MTEGCSTQQVMAVREFLLARIDGDKQAIEARLDAHDEAVRLMADKVDREPTTSALHGMLEALNARVEERFRGTEANIAAQRVLREGQIDHFKEQLKQRDLQINTLAQSTAAAQQKAEENVDKQIGRLDQSATLRGDAIHAQVADLKDRLTAMEARGAGGKDLWALIGGGILLLAAIIGAVAVFTGRP